MGAEIQGLLGTNILLRGFPALKPGAALVLSFLFATLGDFVFNDAGLDTK